MCSLLLFSLYFRLKIIDTIRKMQKQQAILKMNEYGKNQIPFLFIIDFLQEKNRIIPLSEVSENEILFNLNGLFFNDNIEALWGAQSDSGMILALNRCLEMYDPALCTKFFGGKKTYLWLLIPTLHSLCFLFFTKPVLFNGIYVSWFFNPHVGYYNDLDFTVSYLFYFLPIIDGIVVCESSPYYS